MVDEDRPMNELIVKDGQTCLTRENFVSLGLRREMDSMVGNIFIFKVIALFLELGLKVMYLQVGNACFRLIKEIFQHQVCLSYYTDICDQFN